MFDGRKEKKEALDRKKAWVGALTVFLIGLIVLFVGISLIAPAFAQETTPIDTYLTNLDYLFDSDSSINVFFLIILLIALVMFTYYALQNRDDNLSLVFALGAMVICFVLTLLFSSSVIIDLSMSVTNVNVILDPNNATFTETGKTTYEIPIITNDRQFRMILSMFFSLFGVFNALLSMLIIFYYKPRGQ